MIRLAFFPLAVALAILILLFIATDDAGASRASVRATICEVFGARCGPALRVAACETGGTFDPLARGRAGERGLFQLHPVHFGWLNEARLFEPRYNARAAYILSRGGRDWDAWSCKP